jgi:hypothetical protein
MKNLLAVVGCGVVAVILCLPLQLLSMGIYTYRTDRKKFKFGRSARSGPALGPGLMTDIPVGIPTQDTLYYVMRVRINRRLITKWMYVVVLTLHAVLYHVARHVFFFSKTSFELPGWQNGSIINK